ncbi:MAG: hypothetical protein M1337_06795 [Actinobacteria bacterium]|jgi:hypothetical protein|uniref:hypothetical protein n=1 Tax=Nocardioides sp. AE5 TaxID=2962573 RepID=UPI0028812054|nr:hypothetical protein [Nocardioides sp. AE5]MCL4368857.1 hypothetical protein [Actinomycetota bacterium]MDT0203891.1 hypothetical protein [Nocardioides sp. AE5]
MSLLNPATAYRRSTSRPRIPVVLPLVRVAVDDTGSLSVTVDDQPLADEASARSRGELRPLLDRIATEQESALRVEIHEPDGKVFTDFHTLEPTATPSPASEPVTHARSTHDGQPIVNVRAGSLTGEGFQSKEQVFVAIVVHTTTSNSDGTLDLHLPVALLDRTAGDVVLVGKVSGATRPSPDESDASERDAS